MKTLARTGAVLSFTFFFLAGSWLTFIHDPQQEPGVIVFGLIVLGIAFSVGPSLWLKGENYSATPHRK